MLRFILWVYNRNKAGASIDAVSQSHATLDLALTALYAESTKTEAHVVDTAIKNGRTTYYLKDGDSWKKVTLRTLKRHIKEKCGA